MGIRPSERLKVWGCIIGGTILAGCAPGLIAEPDTETGNDGYKKEGETSSPDGKFVSYFYGSGKSYRLIVEEVASGTETVMRSEIERMVSPVAWNSDGTVMAWAEQKGNHVDVMYDFRGGTGAKEVYGFCDRKVEPTFIDNTLYWTEWYSNDPHPKVSWNGNPWVDPFSHQLGTNGDECRPRKVDGKLVYNTHCQPVIDKYNDLK